MPLNDNVALADKPYTLVSVNKTKAPQGSEGNNWYQYIIQRNGSTMVGYRCGTLSQVKNYARDNVEKLNFRYGRRTNLSIWSRPNKKGAKT